MGIVVFNATREFKTEDIVQAAIGMEDARGNPFKTVTLDWSQSKPNTHLAKSRGFEDACITRLDRGLKIEYRFPGSAVWVVNKLTNQYSATIPFTKHNLAILGSHFKDGLWTIRDRAVRDQAELIWNKIRDSMTDLQRKEDDKRITGMHTSMYENVEDQPNLKDFAGKPEEERLQVLSERADLVKFQNMLDEKERKIADDKAWLEGKMAELQGKGIVLSGESESSLNAMKMPEIRNAAKSAGIKWMPNQNKEELIALILKAQYTPDISGTDGTTDVTGSSEMVDVEQGDVPKGSKKPATVTS